MTGELQDDFGRLLEAVQHGTPIPADSPYAGELRLAVALTALARPPSRAFEDALGARLDLRAAAMTWDRGLRHGPLPMPRLVYAGIAAAVITTSTVLVTTPAGPALADAFDRLVRVFVHPGAPPKDAEETERLRPVPSADFASLAAELPFAVGYPEYLPPGWVELRTSSSQQPPFEQAIVVAFGLAGSNEASTVFVVGVPSEPVDLALRGEEVRADGFEGVLHDPGLSGDMRVLTWTDGQAVYELFSPLPVDEMLKIASSVR